MSGRFITVEGIEGVGKSTQVTRLASLLEKLGIPQLVTREPGGTPLAERIREIVLTAREEILPPKAELLLMFASRAVHLANKIEPALANGSWVICDRFTDATYAYQGAGRGMDLEAIAMLEKLVQGARRPDLTLLLDAPVEQALERADKRRGSERKDRFESERVEFFARVREGYRTRARLEPQRFALIDATLSLDEVTERMVMAVKERGWIT